MGTDDYSWCFNGTELLHNNEAVQQDYYEQNLWRNGDAIGCGVDIDKGTIKYYIKGRDIGMTFENIKFDKNDPICPAVQFHRINVLILNLKKIISYIQCLVDIKKYNLKMIQIHFDFQLMKNIIML